MCRKQDARSTSLDFARDERRNCAARSAAPRDGFTLLEALIAMAIVAVAAAGLVRAIEGHVDSIRALELRAAARWVAENRLAELTVAPEERVVGMSQTEMMGARWQIATQFRASDDPALRVAEVAVGPPGAAPLVRLTGFIDIGEAGR